MRLLSFLILATCLILIFFTPESPQADKWLDKNYPYYDRFLEYNYPNETIDLASYVRSIEKVNEQRLAIKSRSAGFDDEWIIQGPGNIGARVNTLAINPNNADEIYAGFSGGGLFKTEDGGANWNPIFDQNAFLSIGYVGIDPEDDQTIYVGTGDPNLSGLPSIGNGVFKSTNGGDSWEALGLEEQRIISKVEVNPQNTDQLFVASMGLPFEYSDTRGIFRSNDGGANWDQVLLVSDSTGFTDVIINPEQPNIIYATSWDRVRSNTINFVSGEGSNFYRSTDGGDNWDRIINGLPDTILGRHGMDYCKSAPNNVYVVIVNSDSDLEGIYRSQDYGASFVEVNTDNLDQGVLGGFGWYFGKIHVNPRDPEHIFLLGVDMFETKDGGLTWLESTPPWWTYEVHADKHDLQFLANGQIFLATDGGVYSKHIDEEFWTDIENIPATQFYRTGYNPHSPETYYGGAQDNGTTGGNALAPNDWARIYGGDGFQMVFHPTDPDLYFVETQRGNIIQILNNYPDNATEGLEGPRDWDMQYIMSTHAPSIMYTGTDKVYMSVDSYDPFWEPISDDLTDGGIVANRAANITTIHESPVEFGTLIVGTNNGFVHIQRAGGDWIDVSNNLPLRYVTDVRMSPSYESWAYVSFSGFKDNDFSPTLFKTTDYGQTWDPIVGNLPEVTINDLFVVPDTDDELIFIATDAGVYGTEDGGEFWERVGTNMPNIKIYDLAFNEESKEIVAATYARSIQSYNIEELLTGSSKSEDEEASFVDFYPNPSTGIVQFDGINKAKIKVINGQGQIVLQQMDVNETIDLTSLPDGWYWLNIENADGQRMVKKLVLTR